MASRGIFLNDSAYPKVTYSPMDSEHYFFKKRKITVFQPFNSPIAPLSSKPPGCSLLWGIKFIYRVFLVNYWSKIFCVCVIKNYHLVQLLYHLSFCFDLLKWRRSRTGKTLSPPQIHQKSI